MRRECSRVEGAEAARGGGFGRGAVRGSVLGQSSRIACGAR
ncbi:hypothetical protein DB32_002496 [Sandaracinus amylolyticus]|uniref:Uncharacterized protein n=1 Tax=Sandaracinus amylolyticus TaxID=927083 RepID=A0A0F6YIQ0_9BACT|nr:hypothetical protein DB32_002496 [Sandaracinus amylolyticus]